MHMYKIKWFNHKIKKKITLLVIVFTFMHFKIKENSEWQKSKILLKYYWIINFCCNYTWNVLNLYFS